MLATNPAAFSQLFLSHLDELDPLESLRFLAEVRRLVHDATDEQLCRARLAGFSWRSMSTASGVGHSTTRRWAVVGAPQQIRRRV